MELWQIFAEQNRRHPYPHALAVGKGFAPQVTGIGTMDIFDQRAARPMLCAGEADPFDSADFVYELKLDGERCLAYVDSSTFDLVSRRGRRLHMHFPELADAHAQVRGQAILDGELIVGVGSKEDFDLFKQRMVAKRPYTINRLAREIPATFVVHDVLYHNGELLTHVPLLDRHARLTDLIDESDRLCVARTIEEKGVEFYRLVQAQGLEGVIAKRKTSLYKMGKRTRDWVKFKNWLSDDFVICGYVIGENASVATLILGQYTLDGHLVYKGRVILGLNREEFHLVENQPPAVRHPFLHQPPAWTNHAVWLQPRLVCTAGFLSLTEGNRLRQAFFKHLVPDKLPRSAIEAA